MSRRTWTRLGALSAAPALLAATLVAGASPASAASPVGQLEVVEVTEVVSSSSTSPKTAIAICPEGTVVLGGGGSVWASRPADDPKVVMTQVEPVHAGVLNAVVVTGREVAPGFDGNWGVDAHAYCGLRPAGYTIATDSIPWSSTATKEAIAECPGNKLTLGSGARIDNSGGRVYLHMARSSGPRDIVRAKGREDPGGFSGNWGITAYAICADPRPGFTAKYGGSELTGPEDVKAAHMQCPSGTFVHNLGASISGLAPAGVTILGIYPTSSRSATAYAVETRPTNASWDLAVQAICGP